LPRIVRGRDHALVLDGQLPPTALALTRQGGRIVTDHRTSWVRELRLQGRSFFVKVYEYLTWGDRLRNFARRTGPFARSRAAAEFDALAWMRRHGLPTAEPILAAESRRGGFLVRATLVTAAFGEPVGDWLGRIGPDERTALAQAIGGLVGQLHRLGFRDRNLDLRNLLAQRDDSGAWTVAKIDSPRHRLCAPGRDGDRLAAADWARLLPQLAPHGLADTARAAASGAGRPA